MRTDNRSNNGNGISDCDSRPRTEGHRRRNRNDADALPLVMHGATTKVAVLAMVFLVATTNTAGVSVSAFCRNPTRGWKIPHTEPSGFSWKDARGSVSSSALALFRPDWMRKYGRMVDKQKAPRTMQDSLKKRKEELGIRERAPRLPLPTDNRSDEKIKTTVPRKYRVVPSSMDNDNSNSNDNTDGSGNKRNDNDAAANDDNSEDLLKIYLFVPEDEIDASDESNVMDRLQNGEIVTSERTKTVAEANDEAAAAAAAEAARVPVAVAAARAIYNVPGPAPPASASPSGVLWIEHDRGGWSPSVVNGATRLIPIDGNDDGGSDTDE